MLNSAQLAITASNDIKNATGMSNKSLAVVFFTNRVIATTAHHPIITRTIDIATQKLIAFKAAAARALGTPKEHAMAKEKPFYTTGPYVLNLALQQAGDSTPTNVIPSKWIYPVSLDDHEQLVMFGHQKDRSVHQKGVSTSGTDGWSDRPWLMHRSMPNYFTYAQNPESRFSPEDYAAIRAPEHLDANSSDQNTMSAQRAKIGAVTVFLHHNKAGGTGVKVALQQLYQITPNLTHASVFSTSACSYSSEAIARNQKVATLPAFCNSGAWNTRHLPPCGRCRGAASVDVHEVGGVEKQTPRDQSPDGSKGQVATAVCRELKRGGRCGHASLRGKCCKTCGADSCPQLHEQKVAAEVAPGGQFGAAATKRCANIKARGECSASQNIGFCCATCGAESCATASMLVGDYAMGICKVVSADRPCAYYTMLREPRQRIASSYLHCQYEPDDQLCMTHVLDARDATFVQWVGHQGNYLLRQLLFDISMSLSIEEQYTMYIQYLKHQQQLQKLGKSGAWMDPDSGSNDSKRQGGVDIDSTRSQESLLLPAGQAKSASQPQAGAAALTAVEEKALAYKPNMMWLLEQQRMKPVGDVDAEMIVESLESLFAVIGIVEKFNESLAMYEQAFGLPYVEAAQHTSREQAAQQMHIHVGEDISTRKQMQEGLVRQFVDNPDLDKLIEWDLKLYEKALEIFGKQEKALWKMRPDVAKLYNPKLAAKDGQSKKPFGIKESPGLQGWIQWAKSGVADGFVKMSGATTASPYQTATAASAAQTTVPQTTAPWLATAAVGTRKEDGADEHQAKYNSASVVPVEQAADPAVDDASVPKATADGDNGGRASDNGPESRTPPSASSPPLKAAEPLLDYDEEMKLAAGLEEISMMRHQALHG